MAPEVGLYLDECFFSSYNHKWKHTHEELSMKAYAEEAEEFKMKYIYPHVASMEHKEGSVALWLHSLNYRNYADLRAAKSSPSSNVLGDAVMDNIPAAESAPSSDVLGDAVVENLCAAESVPSSGVQGDEVVENLRAAESVLSSDVHGDEVVENCASSDVKHGENVNLDQ